MSSIIEQAGLALFLVGMAGVLLLVSRLLRGTLTNFTPLAIGLVASAALVYQVTSLIVWLPILGAVTLFVLSPAPAVNKLRQ